MQIECPHCGKLLGSEHINTKINIVTCDECDAVFSPPVKIQEEFYRHKIVIEELSTLNNFTIKRDINTLQIKYKDNSCIALLLIMLAILISIFLPILSSFTRSIYNNDQGTIFVFALFIGLLILAKAITMLINTSTVFVNRKALTIKHRPIPVPLDKKISTKEIIQLFTRAYATRSRWDSEKITYQLHAVLKSGEKKILISNLTDPKQAMFIEQEVEIFLGIENRRIPGEYQLN